MLVHNALSSRWWWSKMKIKDENYNFLWTQLKNKRFVTNLKKHTEAWVIISKATSIKNADSSKQADSDVEGSRANESSEETATTPSSSKRVARLYAHDRVRNKHSVDIPYSRKKFGQKAPKPPMQCDSSLISNHLEFHIHLSNKKALYYNMKTYYESLGDNPFDYIPLTFHIKDGVYSQEFNNFLAEYNRIEESIQCSDSKRKPHNIWIVKPGENTNRGSGINVWNEIKQIK